MSATGNIVKDEHGTYRWVYEFNLWTNPTILFTVLVNLIMRRPIHRIDMVESMKAVD